MMSFTRGPGPRIRRISSLSPASLGPAVAAMRLSLVSVAWGTANRALYVPLEIDSPTVLRRFFWHPNTTANFDAALLRADDGVRVSSTGSVAGGGNIYKEVDVTDVTLGVGDYILALNCDSSTGQTRCWQPGNVGMTRGFGVLQEALGSVTIPDPATPAQCAATFFPFVGIMVEDAA